VRLTLIRISFQEDAPSTQKARVTAEDATGAATGVDGEGYWVKIADLSTITCNVYDRSSATPDVAILSPTVTVATAMRDAPVASNIVWTGDGDGAIVGWNFSHEVPGTAFPTGGHLYCIEYTFTPTAGAGYGSHIRYEGVASPVVGS
jgi:hypothetical protein